jgi:hypothetical protein
MHESQNDTEFYSSGQTRNYQSFRDPLRRTERPEKLTIALLDDPGYMSLAQSVSGLEMQNQLHTQGQLRQVLCRL